MMWALNDKQHPYFHAKESKRFWNERDELYRKHDRILGKVLKKLPKDVPIIVMSDHGFAPFRRKVNINTWLYKEGYLKLSINDLSDDISILEYADWSRTKSYAIGLNGLYINLKGREREGVVTKTEKRRLLEEIKSKLEMLRDPLNGKKVISNAYISEDHFSKDFLGRAPDIIIGYNRE